MVENLRGTLAKQDLIKAAAHKLTDLDRRAATELIEIIFETLKSTLASGENLKISGFGTFEIRSKRVRMGRNPQTGEPVQISARRIVKFHPSEVLREELTADLGTSQLSQGTSS